MKILELTASEFCDSVRDGTHDSPKPVEGDGKPLVTTRHMKSGNINLDDAYLISKPDFDKVNERSQVHQWDVLISMIGTLGELVLVKNKPTYAIKNIGLFKTKSKYDGMWLYYYLNSPLAKNFMRTSAQGSTQQYLSLKTLRSFPILVPESENNKRAICEILSSIDDKIALNQNMNQTLEEIAKAIFKSWFVDFDPVRAKAEGRPTGLPPEISDLFPSELVDSEIGEIPKGWGLKPIYDLGEFINGAVYKKFEPNKEGLGLPIVKIAELKSGVTDQTGFSTVDMGEKYLVQKRDILFSWSGNPDTSIDIFVWQRDNAWLNQHIFKVVPKEDVSRSFLLQLLKSKKPVFTEIARNKQTTGLGHVTVKDLKEMEIAIPPLTAFDAALQILSDLQDRIFVGMQESLCLSELRDTLLPKLISGELRIPDAEKFLQEAGI